VDISRDISQLKRRIAFSQQEACFFILLEMDLSLLLGSLYLATS